MNQALGDNLTNTNDPPAGGWEFHPDKSGQVLTIKKTPAKQALIPVKVSNALINY